MKRMTQSARTTTANLPIWKKILFSLIIAVGFPVAGILAIEGAGYAIIHFMYGVPGKSYGLWTYDAEIGAIHASNGYNSNSETNNYGFRNKEDVLDPKPPGQPAKRGAVPGHLQPSPQPTQFPPRSQPAQGRRKGLHCTGGL